VTAWTALLQSTRTVFGAPSFAIFTQLLNGWVCAPGRRTITAVIAVADPGGTRAHDAYHRFVRDGVWAMDRLWQVLAVHAVTRFAPTGVVSLDLDHTLFHRDGRHVNGAGTFRDAVRSTLRRVVYARGLNLVVLTLPTQAPWGGCPIAVPINVALHQKKDTTTTTAHAAAMIRELAGWLPERTFHLCADGAYACLAGAHLPRTHLTSRIRRDAALYQAGPRPPANAGDRAPRATGCPPHPDRRDSPPKPVGQGHHRHPWTTRATARPRPRRPLVRRQQDRPGPPGHRPRPDGVEPDDFFITTDRAATGADVASRYAGRWSIEVCFRDVKQALGGQDPQTWKRYGPERAAGVRGHLLRPTRAASCWTEQSLQCVSTLLGLPVLCAERYSMALSCMPAWPDRHNVRRLHGSLRNVPPVE